MRFRLPVLTYGGILLVIFTVLGMMYDGGFKVDVISQAQSFFKRGTGTSNSSKEQKTTQSYIYTTKATSEHRGATDITKTKTIDRKQREIISTLSKLPRVTESTKAAINKKSERATTKVHAKQAQNGRRDKETKKNTSTSDSKISYPLNMDMVDVIKRLDSNKPVTAKPINLHDFKYVYNPSFRCEVQDGMYPFVVILVKSACANVKKREIIRRTWGNVTEYNNTVQVVFLLGNSSKHNKQVAEEYNNFTDIVSEDFVDSYMNNTYKAIMGFKWAVKYCSKSKFFLFVDDDYFVNVKNVIKFLRNTHNNNLFTGYVVWRGGPERSGKVVCFKERLPG